MKLLIENISWILEIDGGNLRDDLMTWFEAYFFKDVDFVPFTSAIKMEQRIGLELAGTAGKQTILLQGKFISCEETEPGEVLFFFHNVRELFHVLFERGTVTMM